MTTENRTRLIYQAAERKLHRIDRDIKLKSKIIKNGKKTVKRKVDGIWTEVTKNLTPAEILGEKTQLQQLKTDRTKARVKLTESRFNYKKACSSRSAKLRSERKLYTDKQKQNRISHANDLLTNFLQKGDQDKVRSFCNNFNSQNTFSDVDFIKAVLPLLNENNNGRPIQSLGRDSLIVLKKTVNEFYAENMKEIFNESVNDIVSEIIENS